MTNSRSFRHKLLIGASISAMLLSSVAEAQSGRVSRGRGAGGDPTAAAARAAQDQAIRQAETNSATQRALDAFRRAAQTRTQMQDAQIQARIVAQSALNTVPNGLGQGGLQAAPEIEIDPSLWVGAKGPTQSAGRKAAPMSRWSRPRARQSSPGTVSTSDVKPTWHSTSRALIGSS
jgi:hypothetical protein